jgi:hypothetical protein
MKRLHVTVLDLVNKGPSKDLFGRLMLGRSLDVLRGHRLRPTAHATVEPDLQPGCHLGD